MASAKHRFVSHSEASSDRTLPYAYQDQNSEFHENSDGDGGYGPMQDDEEGVEDTSPARFKSQPKSVIGRVSGNSSHRNRSRDRSRSPLHHDLNSSRHPKVHFKGDSDAKQAAGNHDSQFIIEAVSASLRSELQNMALSRDQKEASTSSELEKLKLQHKTDSLLAGALALKSEGNRAQWHAFAKVKSSLADIRHKLESHDVLGALASIESGERIVDLRLDIIKRADSLPGGWPVATIFERKVLGDADEKQDKAWASAESEYNAKKKSSVFDADAGLRRRARSRPSRAREYSSEVEPYYNADFTQRYNAPFRYVCNVFTRNDNIIDKVGFGYVKCHSL
jgi:hypothetical protein